MSLNDFTADGQAKLAKTEEQKAIEQKAERELRHAATSMQSVYRGWKSRNGKGGDADRKEDEQAG